MESTTIRPQEMKAIKLKPPIPLAPALGFNFRNELDADVKIVVDGKNISIQKA